MIKRVIFEKIVKKECYREYFIKRLYLIYGKNLTYLRLRRFIKYFYFKMNFKKRNKIMFSENSLRVI